MAAKQAADAVPDPGRPIYLQEAKLRTEAALAADIGFAERLVWFWSNHFCISANKIQSMSGAYEREAVRANALGRFVDLLLAVEGHPAMLFYLDNLGSMGANSIAGINRSRGLNENIAREIMELHTLGVRTGYTQDDVISFANVLTGWTLVPPGDDPQHGGEFTFNPRLHEPGGQTVLGKRYEQEDAEQGRAVLRDLAAHPATATHVATKLARHFVADEPPPALVEQMAKTFRDTEGDLKQVAITMVSSDEAWRGPPSKLKRPGEWGVGMVRATGITVVDPARFTGGQELLGEALWRPSAPKGYPDDEASWIDGIGRRLDIANNFAERIGGHGRSASHHRGCLRIADRARGEAGGRPRREPAAGTGAAVHVGGFSEEVSMGFVNHLPTRRELLVGSGALFAWSQMPRIARAEGRDPRLLVIVLRGALDGLGAVAPVGDPDWVGLRGDRALVLDGKPPALPLDSFFALNPAMPNLHRLYKTGKAAIVHATATPYRERSHFDGQDVLESGFRSPASPLRDGSTARCSRWSRVGASIRAAAVRSASAR